MMARANWHFQQRDSENAERLCHQVIAVEPAHVHALNLLGLIFQSAGRNRAAVKTFTKAVNSDPFNAACHFNLANSYQALARLDDAHTHFKKAIVFGATQSNAEKLILQSPIIARCIDRIAAKWPSRCSQDELLAPSEWRAVADDIFLRCALTSIPLRGVPLERFLTLIRSELLQAAYFHFFGSNPFARELVTLLSDLAQQCFINEYVFAQTQEEKQRAGELRDLLLKRSSDGGDIPMLLPAAVAAYMPLHTLSAAHALFSKRWETEAAGLIRVLLHEPLEETEIRSSIPVLTAVEDQTSLQVMQQYEENPYPRWTIDPLAAVAADCAARVEPDDAFASPGQILIAGCGTGQHVLAISRRYPKAEILAVDISQSSLAYAERKSRQAHLMNVKYARADILEIEKIGMHFDHIEAVGVLHHLRDPERGWANLLSLLRPGGEMRLGLYSERARKSISEARVLIASRKYRATDEDIRKCRQEILRDYEQRGWWKIIESADFYTMSGCRDLLFHVMEHCFTIPRIKKFLDQQKLAFLGFELDRADTDSFQAEYGAPSLTDLDAWERFEWAHPATFRYMYRFTVRKA
jgi:SAM-dependent methyltransferase